VFELFEFDSKDFFLWRFTDTLGLFTCPNGRIHIGADLKGHCTAVGHGISHNSYILEAHNQLKLIYLLQQTT